MFEERKILSTYVFPYLKEFCEKKGLTLLDIDLRWGITDEQVEKGLVLELCFHAISRCSYFIGLLGNYYGSLPSKINDYTMKNFPWIKNYTDRSITELEIRQGVLNSKEERKAFFYFRDSNKEENEITEDTQLASLKTEIKSEELLIRVYKNVEDLKEIILNDFKKSIDEEYPDFPQGDQNDLERHYHEVFAQTRTRLYIRRDEYFRKLDDFVNSEKIKPLVVFGSEGIGKSALLANWTKEYAKKFKDVKIVSHYIGSSPTSSDYEEILRRLSSELRSLYSMEDIDPNSDKSREEIFQDILQRINKDERLILIIDGLDKLEKRKNALDLDWIPEFFPNHIRVILSTSYGQTLNSVNEKGFYKLKVEEITNKQKKQLITTYLSEFSQLLDHKLEEIIVKSPKTGNPLFLSILLSEIRMIGTHIDLKQWIMHYLEVKGLDDLYSKVFRRTEDTFGYTLVSRFLSLLWCSRQGLTEREILDLLRINFREWNPLRFALDSYLLDQSGYLQFHHHSSRRAIYNTYIKNETNKKKLHSELADFFNENIVYQRYIDERPWHLLHAERWVDLKDFLMNPEILTSLSQTQQIFKIIKYWTAIKEKYDLISHYEKLIDEYKESKDVTNLLYLLLSIGKLFDEVGELFEAENIFKKVQSITQRTLGKRNPVYTLSTNNLASIYLKLNQPQRSIKLLEKVSSDEKGMLGEYSSAYATSLNNIGLYYADQGIYQKAEDYFLKSLEIQESLRKQNLNIIITYNNLANVYNGLNRLIEAEDYCKKAINKFKEISFDNPLLSELYNTYASIISKNINRQNESITLIQKAILIDEEYFGKYHPNVAIRLNNLASLMANLENYKEAEQFFKRAIEIYEKHEKNITKLISCYRNLGWLYIEINRDKEAEKYFLKALELDKTRKNRDPISLAKSLSAYGQLLMLKRNHNAAKKNLSQSIEIFEKLSSTKNQAYAKTLFIYGKLLRLTNSRKNAKKVLLRAETLYNEMKHEDPILLYNEIGLTYAELGNTKKAEIYYKKAIDFKGKKYNRGKGSAYHNLGKLYKEMGKYRKAEILHKKALEILKKEKTSDENLADALVAYALVLEKLGRKVEAKRHLVTALKLFEKTLGPTHAYTKDVRNYIRSM